MIVFEFLNNQLFKMQWLSNLITLLLTRMGVDVRTQFGGSIHFFIYDTIKIFILMCVLIYGISYIQSYFPPERTSRILSKIHGFPGYVIGALFGTITPFCSCSSIPLFIGFTGSGLPIGVTFAFLISSPLVDLASFLLLASFFGFPFAMLYVVVGLTLAILGGALIDWLKLEDEVQAFVKAAVVPQATLMEMTHQERHQFAKAQVKRIIQKVYLYIFIGVAVGALIHNWIPTNWIEMMLGRDNIFSVVIATLLGVPIYADIFGTLPIAEALYGKGVEIGTIMSLMMAVTALSIPSLVMLSKVVKPKLLTIFIAIVTVGIMIIGYLFNIFI